LPLVMTFQVNNFQALVTVSVLLVPAVTCCMVYAPANAIVKYHTDLTNCQTTITSQSDPAIIFGSFNMPDINWSTLTGSLIASNNFYKFIFQSNLVISPTHRHSNILDLILMDSAESIVDLTVNPLEYQCISSVHHLISFNTCYKYTTLPRKHLTILEVTLLA